MQPSMPLLLMDHRHHSYRLSMWLSMNMCQCEKLRCDTGKEKEYLPQVGQWSMMNKKVINGSMVRYWSCINFSRSVQESTARGFCQELVQMCQISGMEFDRDPVIPIYSARPDQVKKALKYVYHAAANKLEGKEPELLIAILPDNKGSLYDALSWRIPLVSDIPTIIFGADVTYPESVEDCSPSMAVVVASQDWPEVTKYAVLAWYVLSLIGKNLFKTWQDPQRGTVAGGMIRELLLAFKKATGQKPLRIIFYRDGVSEGQFYQVLLYELDAIRKACASLELTYQPPVTFIVVQKRQHTRLLPTITVTEAAPIRAEIYYLFPNVGTVVDSKICHPTEFDFCLCSHAGIQGTSRPAHFHVLWDENNFTADEIQSLTNNLCYTYARCTRSVSVGTCFLWLREFAKSVFFYIMQCPRHIMLIWQPTELDSTLNWMHPKMVEHDARAQPMDHRFGLYPR
ncbi:hypothetical protein V6N12_002334 [Hibiscus sabdariffa]|uniref:Piwi domain-containing protein n=1 Tax=Hibiscus sabdariffa TaxID=183260 RepID=A0ABR2B0G5_9ROSI